MTVPIIDCRGDILEYEIKDVEGRYLRKQCEVHGCEIYERHDIYLRNKSIIGLLAVSNVYLSQEFSPGSDREQLLRSILMDPQKKAWLFTYATRILDPYGQEKAP